MVLVVMGVAGSGKTTIGRLLAARLGWGFTDADDLHGPASRAKLGRGVPLDDRDREPWLRAIRAAIEAERAAGRDHVYACSALKRAYRGLLAGGDPEVVFVYLRGTRALLADRLRARRGHFVDPELLDSQLETLEPPGPDEAIAVDIDQAPDRIADQVLARLGLA